MGHYYFGVDTVTGAVILWFSMMRVPAGIDHVISVCLAVMVTVTALGLILQRPVTHLGLRLTAAWLERAERFRVEESRPQGQPSPLKDPTVPN